MAFLQRTMCKQAQRQVKEEASRLTYTRKIIQGHQCRLPSDSATLDVQIRKIARQPKLRDAYWKLTV